MACIIDLAARRDPNVAARRPIASGGAEIIALERPVRLPADGASRHDPFGLVAAARALIESFESTKRNAAELSGATSQMRYSAEAIAARSADIRALAARLRQAPKTR